MIWKKSSLFHLASVCLIGSLHAILFTGKHWFIHESSRMDIIYTELMSRADVNWLIRKKFDVSLGLFYIIETNMFFIVLMWACTYKKACQWAQLIVWLSDFEHFSSSCSIGSVFFFLWFSVLSIHTINCPWFDLKNKMICSDWKKSLLKNDQCLRLSSPQRQPPLLVEFNL